MLAVKVKPMIEKEQITNGFPDNTELICTITQYRETYLRELVVSFLLYVKEEICEKNRKHAFDKRFY